MYRKDEPASALLLVHERSTATGTHPFKMGRLVMLLVIGSGVFIVVRTYLSPSLPTWLMPTRPVAPDDVATILMIVVIFEWLTLIAVTILPMSAIAVILDGSG